MSLVVDAQGLVNGVDPAEDPARFNAKNLELGDWLAVWGHITEAQLDLARRESKRKRANLAETLKDLQFVDPRVLGSYFAQRSESENVDVRKLMVPASVRELIPREAALRYLALPIKLDGQKLTVALGNPLDVTAADAISRMVPMAVEFVASTEGDVRDPPVRPRRPP